MKKLLTLIAIQLSGCADINYQGAWVYEGEEITIAIELQDKGTCEFFAAGNTAKCGIGSKCFYHVNGDIIEIHFIPQKQDHMVLLYTPESDTFIMSYPKAEGRRFEFKRRDF